jgi:hypothetical protein
MLERRAAGAAFQAGSDAVDVAALPFSAPFVMPSGRRCRNFNELALACREEPEDAVGLLQKGYLESFLAAQGRTDLAAAANAACQGREGRGDPALTVRAAAADRERGLDDFLGRLPGSALRPARLGVEPAQIDLGALRLGEDRRCELVLHNSGLRLLHGAASVADCPWLSLGDGPVLNRKLFQFFGPRHVLPLLVLGRSLRAYNKPQEAEILLETNGGAATVLVRVDVPVRPFPDGVLAGALSPRQLAEKARAMPREASALVESGAVARWYQDNGWDYPVAGPTAVGTAALQQFFEALGLAKPPRVELSEDAVRLRARPGEKVEHVLAAVTQENRSVVAHAVSDQPWLRIDPTVFRGRSAFLPLVVAEAPARPGETLQASVAVTANGNQRFVVPVFLVIADRPAVPLPVPAALPSGGPAGTKPPAPVAPRAPAPAPFPPPRPPAPSPPGALPSGGPPRPAAFAPPAPPAPAAPKVLAPEAEIGVPARPAETPGPGKRGAGPGARPSWRDAPRARRSCASSALMTLAPAGLLVAALLVVLLRDYLVPAGETRENKEFAVDSVPRLEVRFHNAQRDDELERLWLTDPQPTMRPGLVMLRDGKEVGEGLALKRLTFDPWGRTNNACLRFEGNDDRVFGGARGRKQRRTQPPIRTGPPRAASTSAAPVTGRPASSGPRRRAGRPSSRRIVGRRPRSRPP